MTVQAPSRLPDPKARWIEPNTGRPTKEFYLYMVALDKAVRDLITVTDDHETRITALEP